MPLRQSGAVAAYYRSQFLNTVLPGGVMGDVHRALAHGAEEARIPRCLARGRVGARGRAGGAAGARGGRAHRSGRVGVFERLDGVLLAILAGCAAAALVVALQPPRPPALAWELHPGRAAFAPPGTIVRVVVASVLVISCHVATFVVACLAVGIEASPQRLVAVSIIAVLGGIPPVRRRRLGTTRGCRGVGVRLVGLGAAAGSRPRRPMACSR